MTARVLTAVTAILWSLPLYGQATAGAIQGQVVDNKTGAPVRFATLTLAGPYSEDKFVAPARFSMLAPKELTADEQGRFNFPGLADGNYILNARREAYMPKLYGGTYNTRELIAVKAGQSTSEITMKMAPCGVIAGKVVDETGQPVENAELVAVWYYYGAWRWKPAVTPGTPIKSYTNDLGEFRITNLGNGPFVLRISAPPKGRIKMPGAGYPSIFYPSSLTPEGAEPIVVSSGETSQANITLKPGPSFHISGVIDSRGSTQEACFGLTPKNYNSALTQVIGRVTRFARDGIFVLDGVPPGSYVLSAALCRGDQPLGAIEKIEVAGNIENLRIQLSEGIHLSGVVKAEGVQLAGVKLTLRSPELMPGFVPETAIGADGAFTFDHVLPRHHIVDFYGVPAGAYVKSVKYAGREIPPSGFEIDGDAKLEITLSTENAAQLTGTVLDKSGKPAPHAMVMLLPSDGGPAQSATDAVTDEQGNYRFPALRPGTYKALAWQSRYNPFGVEAADPMLPVLFDSNARSITVQPGVPASLGLTLNTVDDVNRARVANRMAPPKN